MTSRRPNIVFIMPDQWRHDAFGFAGNPVIETPNVDALAARGAVFRGAHCESPICQPSRASLLTGVYARDHGLPKNVIHAGRKRFPAPDAFRTFPQRLRDAGYYTAEIGKMHFGGPRDLARRGNRNADLRDRREWLKQYGFDYSVEELDKGALLLGVRSDYTDYLESKGLLEAWRTHHWPAGKTNPLVVGSSKAEPLDPEDTLDMFIADQAGQFLHNYDHEQPFFLWLAPVGPHPPFDAPAFYRDRYAGVAKRLDGPLIEEPPSIPDNSYGELLRHKVPKSSLGSRASGNPIGPIRQLEGYYGNCTQGDAVVGRVMEALEQKGIADNTRVLLSSDHGEMLGAHAMYGKSVFYSPSVRIPSVVKPPRGLGSPIEVNELTQGFDVTATILDIAGADRAEHLGQSLRPALDGESVGREAAVSEYGDFCMVVTRRYKLIVHSATAEPQQLFDLDNDPDEHTDLHLDPGAKDTVRMLLERYVRPFLTGEWQPGPGRAARSEHA